MQYTIRQISKKLDQAVRKRAKAEGKSVNRFVIDHLADSLGVSSPSAKKRDLSDIAGTWVEDPAFEETRAFFERIDSEMWK